MHRGRRASVDERTARGGFGEQAESTAGSRGEISPDGASDGTASVTPRLLTVPFRQKDRRG
jgi:hypothetical protein